MNSAPPHGTRCPACGSKRVEVIVEGAKVSYQCLDCGHRWSQGRKVR
jgi:DNA-directed RNA polymerase subunit RPC12/RpoP